MDTTNPGFDDGGPDEVVTVDAGLAGIGSDSGVMSASSGAPASGSGAPSAPMVPATSSGATGSSGSSGVSTPVGGSPVDAGLTHCGPGLPRGTLTPASCVDSGGITAGGADAANTGEASVAGGVCSSSSPEGGTNVVTSPDFEANTQPAAGWTGFAGCAFAVVSTVAHCGTHSGACTHRTLTYQGPGYDLPTTGATYNVSAWALHDGQSNAMLLLNAKLVCSASDGGSTTTYPVVSGSVTAPAKTWTRLTGSLTVPRGCTTAQLYLNQSSNPTLPGPAPLPTLYIDDVSATR